VSTHTTPVRKPPLCIENTHCVSHREGCVHTRDKNACRSITAAERALYTHRPPCMEAAVYIWRVFTGRGVGLYTHRPPCMKATVYIWRVFTGRGVCLYTHRPPCMEAAVYIRRVFTGRGVCLYTHRPPCMEAAVYIWRILQGGVPVNYGSGACPRRGHCAAAGGADGAMRR
jgi:hypothetical protein